jgi:hypothetical protein
MGEHQNPISDNQDRAYTVLWDIFRNVNDQLRFAETKNAALITVNFAMVVALGAMLSSDDIVTRDVRTWIFVIAVGLAGAGLFSLASFLPQLGGDTQVGTSGRTPSNLIYFQELAVAGLPELLAAVFLAAEWVRRPNLLHTSLGQQIIINSGIADRKFKSFRIAAVATVVCTTIPTVVLAFTWLGNGGAFK